MAKHMAKSRKYHAKAGRHRRRHSSRYHIKGGAECSSGSAASSSQNPAGFSLVPSTLTDIGRSIQYGTLGAYAATNGNDPPVNPLPYKDQLNGGDLPDDVMLRA